MAKRRTKTQVVQDDGSSACGLELGFDPKSVFGKVRAAVRVTIKGHTFRTTITSMGGKYWVPLNRTNREAAGVQAGEVGAASDAVAGVIPTVPGGDVLSFVHRAADQSPHDSASYVVDG